MLHWKTQASMYWHARHAIGEDTLFFPKTWYIYDQTWTIYAHIWSIYDHIWSIYDHDAPARVSRSMLSMFHCKNTTLYQSFSPNFPGAIFASVFVFVCVLQSKLLVTLVIVFDVFWFRECCFSRVFLHLVFFF